MVLDGLTNALSRGNREERVQIMQCLDAFPSTDEAVLDAIASGLADSDSHVQNHAAVSLAIRGKVGLPRLELALRSENASMRRWAVFGLGQFSTHEAQLAAVPLIIERLADPDRRVKLAAVHALRDLNQRTVYSNGVRQPSPARLAVPALVKELGAPDPELRLEAARSLAQLDASTAESQRIVAEAERHPDQPEMQRQ